MKKLLALVLSVLMLAALVTGCASTPSSGSAPAADGSAPAEKRTIKLGVLAPLTGTNAEYGKGFEVAMQMAVDKINAAGGANGYKLELSVKDSKGDQKESSDLARQFADDEEVMAILGDFTSGACMANAPIVDEAGIVQLSPTASNPDYAGMSDFCFSIMGRQDGEAPFYAKYILKKYMGAKKLGVIYINSDWGKSCYDNFKKQADVEGLELVETVSYVQDEKDFSSLITKLKAANPDTICIMDQGAVPQIINQIKSSGWDIPITTLGPGTSQQLIDLCGKNAEGLLLTSPFFFDPADADITAWKDEFVSKAGFEPTIHPACAYDCVNLIAEAIKASGDGEVTRQTIRDNLAKVEMKGVTGPIKFNETGDITRQYLICGVENGKYVVKEGFDYSKE
ncbi:branched-chain amino acid transport system substrate-binding protein [Hydrogenoanaerobacterium saccharovorans]|uniref:Amino acid/amide ABC transporter substrate-binding protein, HAAT family n=1 Tax=Hydrogenoanaerobacterium saccharovorans TaxID=474960 RepID=A0A1H8B6I2_9FIRM|nr:ABC transporter substrate-binding protein [Hydrogenoanaerobacterium saccharovorans]RPF47560.1 branched-chain amino acid transport system substrate-binding protein [Hydrogenoanaerobacterium saccharovorans]SEM78531.1 amino acid/amide ABC transporter substrate-binding protein, HAAT family [Hydrogenoanaerobacterium saccharovorans]